MKTAALIVAWLSARSGQIATALSYAAACLVLVTLFLYLLFPREKLSDWVLAQTESAIASEIEISSGKMEFPFRLVWSGVTVIPHANPAIRVDLDEIALDWEIIPLIQRQLDLSMRLRGAGGTGLAFLAIQRTPEGPQYRLEGDLLDLDLEQVAEFLGIPPGEISGRLDVSVPTHHWVGDAALQGTGTVEIVASDVVIEAIDLTFDQIKARMKLAAGIGTFEALDARGPVADLVGSGSLVFRNRLSDSLVNLSSRLTVKDTNSLLALANRAGESSADLALRGPLGRPGLFLNGEPMPIDLIKQGV